MPLWPRETWKALETHVKGAFHGVSWQDLPICSRLEENFETIREETARALANEAESGFEAGG